MYGFQKARSGGGLGVGSLQRSRQKQGSSPFTQRWRCQPIRGLLCKVGVDVPFVSFCKVSKDHNEGDKQERVAIGLYL